MTDVDPRDFLPRDKKDFDRAESVIRLSLQQVKPILPELIEWTADGNWPISRIISPYIASLGSVSVPYCRDILKGSDSGWKYFLITDVIKRMTSEVAHELQPELESLSDHPTPDDAQEEVDEAAANCLIGFGWR